jgi:hypothetical protein
MNMANNFKQAAFFAGLQSDMKPYSDEERHSFSWPTLDASSALLCRLQSN